MKKGLTEYVFVLDCSESVVGRKAEYINSFNSMIADYKQQESEGLVTTILFNQRSKIFHDRINLASVNPISEEDYITSGKTALLDALGHTIKHISTIQKYAREEDKPEHTVFVVMTDGREDASKRYTAEEIEKSIQRRKETRNWQFIFTDASLETIITACKVKAENAATDTEDENDLTEYIDSLLRIFENRKS